VVEKQLQPIMFPEEVKMLWPLFIPGEVKFLTYRLCRRRRALRSEAMKHLSLQAALWKTMRSYFKIMV
jgi:hypothetical protein